MVRDTLPASVRIHDAGLQRNGDIVFRRFRFTSSNDFQTVELHLPQLPAVPIDEFKSTVQINSNVAGIGFGFRLEVPGQIDPRNGQPLVATLSRSRYDKADKWQTLTADIPRSAIDAKVRELRAEIKRPDVDLTGAYIEGCVLIVELHKGESYLDVAECTYGPVVKPGHIAKQPAGASIAAPDRRSRLRIERDKVLFEGKHVFPVFTPDHGESIHFLNRLGVNMAWVPDLSATSRMQELLDNKFLVMATPPHPEFDPADFSRPLQGLPPLEQTAPLPDIWYLGTAIRENQLPHLLAWAKEIRSADRVLRRPLMADFVTSEDVASRLVDAVGISQNSIRSFSSFGESRNKSFLRQNASAQLTMPWEWIQTEHSTEYVRWRRTVGARPAYVEPEQIILQMVSCLSAGARGIGVWKTRNLEGNSKNDLETTRAIELASIYVKILEPLLVNAQIDEHIPVQLSDSQQSSRRSDESFIESFLGKSQAGIHRYDEPPSGPDAAVFNGSGASLILAGYWDAASQFVPQQMYASNASLTVAATETASAWQISPTSVRGFRRQPAAGGLRLDLQDFDQLAIALVTSDQEQLRIVESRVQQHAARAAELFVELASLKYARVLTECGRIDEVAGTDSGGRSQLETAAQQILRARTAFERRDFPSCESLAKSAMREVRSVQTRYWYRAIQSLPTPTASPHAVNFSTLADHWTMMRRIETESTSENLLPSGAFDDRTLQADSAWKPVFTQPKKHYASAEVVAERAGQNQVLRMRALRRPGVADEADTHPALLVQCPEIDVEQGDILQITAKIRLGQGVQTTQSAPFLIFDSDLGPEFAVAPGVEPSWRTFSMFRQVSETGPFKLWLALKSPAEIYIDDISVVRRAKAGKTPSDVSRVQGAGYSIPSLP